MVVLQVNLYPMTRGFTAIGIRGDDFVDAMVDAVESVLESPIPEVFHPHALGESRSSWKPLA